MFITVVEPAWDGNFHLPGNLGMLQIVATAFPQARLFYVGGHDQIEKLRALAPATLLERTVCIGWTTAQDALPTPWDVLRAERRWAALPRACIEDADLVVLTSVTPTALRHCAQRRLAGKTIGMLHGNALDIGGWRSRNPYYRWFDLHQSLRAFTAGGGHAMALEDRIAHSLEREHTWLKGRLLTVGHPLIEAEARQAGDCEALRQPIRIGFAGLATAAKGFPQFLETARSLQARAPGRYSFHAFGKVHASMADADQSALQDQAGAVLSRPAFIQALRSLDLLFLWHDDGYYQQAASGIFYDAVNQLLPLVCRKTAALKDLADQGLELGWMFDEPAHLIDHLAQAQPEAVQNMIRRARHGLARHRETFTFPVLAQTLKQQLSLKGIGTPALRAGCS